MISSESHLYHRSWGLLGHVVYGILVTQPIRPFHCVVEMPPPVIVLHVSQSSIDPSLKMKIHFPGIILLKDSLSRFYSFLLEVTHHLCLRVQKIQ